MSTILEPLATKAKPLTWEVEELGCLAETASGTTPARSQHDRYFKNGSHAWVKTMDLNNGEIHTTSERVTDEALSDTCLSMFSEGTVLIAMYGGFFQIGRTGLLKIPAAVNQAITAVLPNRRRLLPEYLIAYLNYHVSYWRTVASSSRKDPNITSVDIKRFRVAFPCIDEQRAIAGALSDVDALLGVLDRMLTKKRDLKQAAMQQLLTGQTRLPGFKGKWEEHEVQDVIERYFCGPSPTCEERNIQGDEEWGVLKTTASTKTNGWDWTKHKTLPRVFWNKPHLELTEGDLIVTKAGPRHRVGVAACVDFVPPRIIVSGKMIGLRPNRSKVVPAMLAAAISQPKAQRYLDQRTTGMAEAQVNFENVALMETTIELPLLDEQAAIAEVLSDMDAEIAALERRREKTQDLKQGMMQELLTGKTRLI